MDKIKNILRHIEIRESMAMITYKQYLGLVEQFSEDPYFKGKLSAYEIALADFKGLLADIRYILKENQNDTLKHENTEDFN